MSRFKGGRRIDYTGKDQYFTKRSVAKRCIDTIAVWDWDVIVEPSAGDGAFLDFLPSGSVAMDIDPMRDDIAKQDFFTYSSNQKTITIGNPPFGRNNSLSLSFFNHASAFSDTIAFIVPVQWKWYSIHKKLPEGWRLAYQEDLAPFSFHKIGQSPGARRLEDGSINVNCVWQIWTKRDTGIDLRKYCEEPEAHEDFTMFGYFIDGNLIEHSYDFYIRGWGGMSWPKRGPGPLSVGTVIEDPTDLKSNWRMQYIGINGSESAKRVFQSIPIERWWKELPSLGHINSKLLVEMYKEYKNTGSL